MPMTFSYPIEQIVQSIFATMLDCEVNCMEGDFQPSQDTLVSFVQITGEWVGSVVLILSPAIVRSAASAMLLMAEEELTDSDVQDVAAELVNMIGGNLKSLLPSPSSLSLPIVVTGSEFNLKMHHAELVDDVVLGSDTGRLRVSLYERM